MWLDLLIGALPSPTFLPLILLQVNTIVFDKTGTLTVGKPVVVSAVIFSSFSMEEVCDMATAAEVSVYILKWYSDTETFMISIPSGSQN